jgi:hypothetical protein
MRGSYAPARHRETGLKCMGRTGNLHGLTAHDSAEEPEGMTGSAMELLIVCYCVEPRTLRRLKALAGGL